jgi:hypothetical protein
MKVRNQNARDQRFVGRFRSVPATSPFRHTNSLGGVTITSCRTPLPSERVAVCVGYPFTCCDRPKSSWTVASPH